MLCSSVATSLALACCTGMTLVVNSPMPGSLSNSAISFSICLIWSSTALTTIEFVRSSGTISTSLDAAAAPPPTCCGTICPVRGSRTSCICCAGGAFSFRKFRTSCSMFRAFVLILKIFRMRGSSGVRLTRSLRATNFRTSRARPMILIWLLSGSAVISVPSASDSKNMST